MKEAIKNLQQNKIKSEMSMPRNLKLNQKYQCQKI